MHFLKKFHKSFFTTLACLALAMGLWSCASTQTSEEASIAETKTNVAASIGQSKNELMVMPFKALMGYYSTGNSDVDNYLKSSPEIFQSLTVSYLRAQGPVCRRGLKVLSVSPERAETLLEQALTTQNYDSFIDSYDDSFDAGIYARVMQSIAETTDTVIVVPRVVVYQLAVSKSTTGTIFDVFSSNKIKFDGVKRKGISSWYKFSDITGFLPVASLRVDVFDRGGTVYLGQGGIDVLAIAGSWTTLKEVTIKDLSDVFSNEEHNSEAVRVALQPFIGSLCGHPE